MWKNSLNLLVGTFLLGGIVILLVLALKVSNFSSYSGKDLFTVSAVFDHIGDLKVRAPVTVSGVRIGEVSNIVLDAKNFRAIVELKIETIYRKLPQDSSAKILTAGIIGANYVELVPGYAEEGLMEGGMIEDTQSAIVIENLVSKLLYSAGQKNIK